MAPSIATFLYVSILRPPASLPNSPDNYGPASTEHTSTSSLNPAFSFSPSLSFCLSLSLSLPTLLANDLSLLPSGKCGCMTYWTCPRVCERGQSFGVVTLQLDSVSAAKQWLSPSKPSFPPSSISLRSACIDSWACSSIPMRVKRRSKGRSKREGERDIEMR